MKNTHRVLGVTETRTKNAVIAVLDIDSRHSVTLATENVAHGALRGPFRDVEYALRDELLADEVPL